MMLSLKAFDAYLGDTKDLGLEIAEVIFYMVDLGMWDFGKMHENCPYSPERNWCDKLYIKYIVARFGAFPHVWFSMANEWQFFGDWEEK